MQKNNQFLWMGLFLLFTLAAMAFISSMVPMLQLPRGYYFLWVFLVCVCGFGTIYLFALQRSLLPPDAKSAQKMIRYGRWGCFGAFLMSVFLLPTGMWGFCCLFCWLIFMGEVHHFHNVLKAFISPETRLAKIIKYPFQQAYDSWQMLKFFSLFITALLLFGIWVEWSLLQTAPQHVTTPMSQQVMSWVLILTPFFILLSIAAWFTRPYENPSLLQQCLRIYLFIWVKYCLILLSLRQFFFEFSSVMQHFHQSNLWYWWLSHPNEPYPQNLLASIEEAKKRSLPNNSQKTRLCTRSHRSNSPKRETPPLYI